MQEPVNTIMVGTTLFPMALDAAMVQSITVCISGCRIACHHNCAERIHSGEPAYHCHIYHIK